MFTVSGRMLAEHYNTDSLKQIADHAFTAAGVISDNARGITDGPLFLQHVADAERFAALGRAITALLRKD
jgi:hypothetical protein